MTKVLVCGNRKSDDIIIDVSTPEKELAAFLKLFKYLDEEWSCYCDLDTAVQEQRYERAKAGDAIAAKALLRSRQSYEYEEWHFANIIDPLSEDKL